MIAATPEVKYRTSIVVWIFLALLVALLAFGCWELFRQMIERGHHDLGGRLAGKVERDEHDYEPWERRIDAMAVLLGLQEAAARWTSAARISRRCRRRCTTA